MQAAQLAGHTQWMIKTSASYCKDALYLSDVKNSII